MSLPNQSVYDFGYIVLCGNEQYIGKLTRVSSARISPLQPPYYCTSYFLY